MKKLILAIVLLCASLAQAGDVTLWGISADGADHSVVGRIGYVQDDVEIGAELAWWDWQPDWGPEPEAAGAFILFHGLDGIIGLPTDEPWLANLTPSPYVGLEELIPCNDDDGGRRPKTNWLAGVLLTLGDSDNGLVVEYASGQGVTTDAISVLRIGARIKF